MKKIVMIFGIVFIGLIVTIVVAASILAVKGNALDRESKDYADSAIVAVVTNWDMNALRARASTEFTSSSNDNDLKKLFGLFRMLGRLVQFNGCKGEAKISFTTQYGMIIVANYVGLVQFENGPAEIVVTLIKHGDQWQILGFRINSKLLSSPA